MFLKNKKTIILVAGITVILCLMIAVFFLLKKEENKEIINHKEAKQESHFLTKEEKEKFGIDPNLEVKMRKAQGDLGLINVVEFPKK
ncbi:MAG: hypothetical protein C0412_18725 [Flavobacterium sp.]|nr:hypothetical protein [Flavobacterium sp.]